VGPHPVTLEIQMASSRSARVRKATRSMARSLDRQTGPARKAGLAKMKTAAKSLERAAADYAKKASAAGLAAKKAAKGMTKTKKGKALTAAALALVGYAAVKMARKR
jgi:hypothetical protein